MAPMINQFILPFLDVPTPTYGDAHMLITIYFSTYTYIC